MAEAEHNFDEDDELCCEFFQMCVEKEQAKTLGKEEKKCGKGTTVRKILKEGLGESPTVISACEASVMPKYQDKAKKVRDVKFVGDMLPDLAVLKCKAKSRDDPKAQEELKKMKGTLAMKMRKLKEPPVTKKETKKDDVVGRLTDASGYTGSHKERFDKEGKGKGIEGRKDIAKNDGYVGDYKGKGTYGTKKA